MVLIRFIIANLIIICVGYCLLALFNFKRHNIAETIALSFGFGSGFVGAMMFFLSIMGFQLNFIIIIIPPIAIFLFYLLYKHKRFLSRRANRDASLCSNFSIFELILSIFIIFEAIYVVIHAGSMPFLEWDAWCNWGFKAKMLFMDKTFAIESWLSSPNLPHLNYPIMLPLQEFYLYLFLGGIYESLAKIFCSFYFIGIVFALYGYLLRDFPRKFALLVCFFLCSTPILLREATIGYADVPFSFYMFLAIINLWHYIKTNVSLRLVLSCIFLGLSMWMKNEGVAFWLATVISLFLVTLANPKILMKKAKTFFSVIFIPWLIFLPWIFIRLRCNIKNEFPLLPLRKVIVLLTERTLPIMKELYFEIVEINSWNIYWLVFLLSVALLVMYRRKNELFLLLIFFFQTIFFLGAFMLCPSSLIEMKEWCRTSLHRPQIQFYPIV